MSPQVIGAVHLSALLSKRTFVPWGQVMSRMRSEQSLDGRCSVSRRHGDRLQNPQNVASPVCRQRVLFAETEMRVEACATSFWPASPDGVFLAVGAREARPGAPVKHPRKQTCAAQEEIRIPSLVRCSKATARPRKYEPQRAHAVFLWSKRSDT